MTETTLYLLLAIILLLLVICYLLIRQMLQENEKASYWYLRFLKERRYKEIQDDL